MTRSLAIIVLAASLGVGCSTPPADSTAAVPAGAAATPNPAAAAVTHDGRAIQITGDDTMKFSVVEITARPGEKLSITLINTGTTPKFSMGHNWVLIAAGIDVQAFLVASAEAVTTDYVPRSAKGNQVLAATTLLGPDERNTVTVTAPSTPGRYEFLCSFPGHYQVGMRGVLIVI